jgi:thiol-disulfide isomerase/thioredoxin
VLAAALAALALAAGCTGDDRPALATPPAGTAAALPGCPEPGRPTTASAGLPDLELPCLGAGGTLRLSRLTGTPTVLNLWASWCPPCREELPAFARLARDGGSRLRVLGVASRDATDNATAFAGEVGLPFPSLEDRAGDLGRGLRRPGLPVTVLVAADGAVVHVYQGPALTDTTLRALVRDEFGLDV